MFIHYKPTKNTKCIVNCNWLLVHKAREESYVFGCEHNVENWKTITDIFYRSDVIKLFFSEDAEQCEMCMEYIMEEMAAGQLIINIPDAFTRTECGSVVPLENIPF